MSQELSSCKEDVSEFIALRKEIKDIENLAKESDAQEMEEILEEFEKKVERAEIKVFLSGKYDKGNAILSIYSGAGGQDAQDWATMLLRMYEKYCSGKGFKSNLLNQSFGEAGGPEGRIGTKSATLEIKGKYAYGFLKKENGVHRLVRLSPFNAKALRQTSFALVEVLPEISKAEESEIKISPEDLKIETYHSSGAGGQYVNKRETAVRITHLPTGLLAASQTERNLAQNKENAMKVLLAKLHQLKNEEAKKELKEIKGEAVSASWGNQIRSYVLHPYKLVKDLRTDVETSQVEEVLDGNLDDFIEAEIRLEFPI